MSVREDPRANLAQLEAMVGALDRYLESDSVYRQVVVEMPGPGAGRHTITMSLGVMLDLVEALAETSRELDPDTRDASQAAIRAFESARASHARAYAEKLNRELKSHLDSWRWFLSECADDLPQCERDYPDEVRVRLRIDQLLREAGAQGIDASVAEARLVPLDASLRRMFRAGRYVGPYGATERYPDDTYWWLYGRPER